MSPDHDTNDIEARLRTALTARADAVEPATGADVVPELEARAAAARRGVARRRVLLSVAAVVAVVAMVTGAAIAIGGDDDEGLQTADDPSTTTTEGTTTTVDVISPLDDLPTIWPLPTMSLVYGSPEDAVAGLLTGYLGVDVAECAPSVLPVTDGADVSWACNYDGLVRLRDDGARGWVVLAAETEEFALSSPEAGSVHAGRFPIGLSSPTAVEVEVRRLGSLDRVAEGTFGPGDVDAELGPEDEAAGDYVVLARTPTAFVLRAVQLSGPAPTTTSTTPTTTTPTTQPTTTTTAPPDDGAVGWPGTSVGGFPDPVEAAVAFADQVLGFADTTVRGSGGENDLFVTVSSRPTSTATTTIQVHDTGARGWIVLGAQSDQGRIDTPTQGQSIGLPVRVAGVATAFEANLTVQLLSLSGQPFGSTFTTSGANGEQGPFDTTVDADPGANPTGGPTFVLIGDSDESGEGGFTWAAVVLVSL